MRTDVHGAVMAVRRRDPVRYRDGGTHARQAGMPLPASSYVHVRPYTPPTSAYPKAGDMCTRCVMRPGPRA